MGWSPPRAYPDRVTPRAADAAPDGTAESAPPLRVPPPARAPLTEDVPRIYPRRLPEPTRRELIRRGRTIAKVVAVHFTPTALRQLRTIRHGALPAAQLARPLRKSFQDLGGTFMKFGQIIASSPGMFGDEVADEFRACLDTGPPVPYPDVRQRVEEDLGLSLRDAFAEFEPRPIGTASIAVVHRARLLDGRVVAVKVLRPGIEHVVATDLDLMQPLLEILVRQTGDQMAGSTLQLLDGFRVQIGEEMDLRNEARLARPLPAAAERVRPEADGGARALPGALGAQRPDDGILRRRADRRPGPGGRPRLRPHARWSRRSCAPSS